MATTNSIIDLTQPLDSDMSIYPGDPTFALCAHSHIDTDGYSVQRISLGSHTGTHVDAPSHFIPPGKSIDQVPLASFIGHALVIDVSHKKARERISWEADVLPYAPQIHADTVVLFYTDWQRHWKTPTYLDHPFLDKAIASHLVSLGVLRIGIDTLSPDETEGPSGDFGVHEVILGADGLIIENLCNLENIPTSPAAMISFVPLNLKGGDGSPVRAYAWIP